MEKLIKEKWNEIQKVLREDLDISEISYKTWLESLKIVNVDNGTIVLETDDEISRGYIERKYSKPLQIAIREIIGEPYKLQFVLPNESITNKSDATKEKANQHVYNNLNARYTFNTFVVGNNNKLAHAAALAVAESPAEAYNPLFIYGGVGLGKTHLMHSIAHFILNENNASKVLYVSSEKFTNELINSIRDDRNEEFRKKYRSIDVLLVDDIQFIAGKERTQEEFFHTFNTLYEAKKQIIISSDRPPKEIETLEERLRSRFEWGLIADIQAPDFETRMAILRKKAELENLNIPNEVVQYVATNIKSNIRELEGAMNKIIAYSTLVHKEITKELAEDALKDLITPNEQKDITPDFITNIVAQHYGLNPDDIFSKKRTREIAYPRQIVMYLCRKLTDTSLQNIGKSLGNRDHTTIMHGSDKIGTEINKDLALKNTIEILTKKITGK
ncbi:chromosomal replication initiator protein DnaA [Natranaerovirga pectinivora]|uniref:Chromosomal replication initiator protein DnaA n=1 Tax=Natranaerovirga pectinivora TaxID=682400 RepID=A0A4R3MGJ8_9FIRM|nr:chromosomal replication initiator protein DnaA [Natranaerovirga pectinivora]TCT12240.1 chromosomal replication initiator protein DnaA [Natranaerovirga pectinivora]